MESEKCCQLNNALLFWGVDPRQLSRLKCTQVDREKERILNTDHEFPKRGQQRWGTELGALDFKELSSPD